MFGLVLVSLQNSNHNLVNDAFYELSSDLPYVFVFQQLHTHLQQLGEMREEIDACDLRQFDQRVRQVQAQILQAICAFRKLDSQQDGKWREGQTIDLETRVVTSLV